MFTKLGAGLLAGSVLLVSLAGASQAQTAYGVWLRPKTGGQIQSFPCGGGIGLKVVASRKPSLIGKTLMCGAKAVSPGRFVGRIRNAEDGRTYQGRVVVQGGRLRLSGCILGGTICRTETWRRLR